jgi:hypothetical protein
MSKQKWLREFSLNSASGKSRQFAFRDGLSILEPDPRRVTNFKRGVPVFSHEVDTIRNLATGNRQYKGPVLKTNLATNYDESNYHEMLAKFHFRLDGRFPDGGIVFETEVHSVASDLFLVGFIKVRSSYAMGHLQGDVYAMSYMRKWFEDRYNVSGRVDSVHIFGDSYGIPELRYTKLECIKDWRSPVRRRQHMGSLTEDMRISELERKTRDRSDLSALQR